MSTDTDSASPRHFPRHLFGDLALNTLFEPTWAGDLVPLAMLAQSLAMLAPAVTAPVVTAPGVAAPTVAPPMVTTPAVTAPEASAPAVTAPVATATVATNPVETVPAAAAPVPPFPPPSPAVTTPVVTAPAVTDPAVTAPVVTAPPVTAPVTPPPVTAPPLSVTPAPAMPDIAAATTNLAAIDGADQAMHGNQARANSGVSGSGVVIGILSDSFDVRGGYAGDVAQGLLNSGITVLKEGSAGSSDEGRAMAELIHQVAPDAQIMFYSAFGGAADFANGIRSLANAGASVIVDDVTYLNEPFYQDGAAIQTAVEQVVASGVSYFTSASNEGHDFYENGFSPVYSALPGLSGGFVSANFGTAAAPSPYVNLTIAQGATATIDLQWDAPFASIGGTGAATSLGMVLYDSSGHIVAYALRSAIGGDPVALMQFTNTSASTSFHMAVITDGGRGMPGQFKFIAYGNGTTIDDPRAGIGSGTIIGHEMVPEANTVGAAAYGGTALESFSSVGPGSFLFDSQGNRLANPVHGSGIDYVAPDGSATSVFNPFYGTSAAAPNAAAVAALMLQHSPNLTPAQISAILAHSTVAATGPAAGIGAGLIQADAAVKAAIALGGPSGASQVNNLAPVQAASAGTVQTSAAIRAAADALTADLASQPAMTSDFTALPDYASGLVLANGDSLGGAAYADLALMYGAPTLGGLYDPVHLLSLAG